MKIETIKKQTGIGLIEIMIALVVVAVGILGIVKLQKEVIRSASDANARAVAAVIAQAKIDDLRSYVNLLNSDVPAGANDIDAITFEQINTNLGGLIDAGPVSAAALGIDSNVVFNLSWTLLGNYYYPDTELTVASTTPNGPNPDFKLIQVNVMWSDIDGSPQTHSLKTVIDGYSPLFTAKFGNANLGSNPPIIPYTPEAAPDVVPVSLETDDGLKKETAKPLPDVSKKGASTSVQFESVTYNQTLDTVKREDFKTLACLCTQASAAPTNTDTIQYGTTVWDAENIKLKDEVRELTAAEKALSYQKSKVDNSGGELQDANCYTCCRDAPDVSASVNYKACRLKRIDGIYRIYDPWKMIAFNLIPASYFDASAALPTILGVGSNMNAASAQANIDAYSDYVTDLVRTRLKDADEATFLAATADSSFAPSDFEDLIGDQVLHRTFQDGAANARQLQARAVFMDYPPVGIYTECASCASPTFPLTKEDYVPLNRVSFSEVNMTELAGWNPDRDDVAFPVDYTTGHDNVGNAPGCSPSSAPARNFVTNDAIENNCETSLSRGEFYPYEVTPDITAPAFVSQAVQTIIYTSNDGVVNRKINNSVSTATATIELKIYD